LLNVIKPNNVLKKIRKVLAARSVVLLIERFFRLGAGAVVTFMVARMLGDSALGVYGFVMVWVAFLAPLTNLGMNNLVQKLASGQADPLKATQFLQTAIWLRVIAGGVMGALMIAGFAWFFPQYFWGDPWQISALFLLQTFFALILFEYQQNYLGHFRAVALSKILLSAITLAVRVIGLLNGAGISFLLLIVGIEFLLTGALQYYWYRRYAAQSPCWHWQFFDWPTARQLLQRSSWLWLSGIISVIYLKIDTVMIASMLGEAATGQYVAVARISELWYVIPTTLAARYYPDMLKAFEQSWPGYLLILRRRGLQFFLLATVIAILMTISAYWIMLLAYGEKFTVSTPVLQIHVWAGCFVFVRALISQHLIITGQEPLSLSSNIVGAVLNVGLNFLLIPRMGIEGAAWATLISYAYASFFFIFFSKKTRAHFFEMLKTKAAAAP
jgi:O-antigen/teichoic acid export membrane protein